VLNFHLRPGGGDANRLLITHSQQKAIKGA
jgi:hypothetical protein